jgi:hypothetical protein
MADQDGTLEKVHKGGIRVQVPLVIEMTAEQAQAYADEYSLSDGKNPVRARVIVEDVQSYVLTWIQDSAAFGASAATVTLKRR